MPNTCKSTSRRVGQDHPKAKLTDREVDRMRNMHENDGWGYRRLSVTFEVALATVKGICRYRTRT